MQSPPGKTPLQNNGRGGPDVWFMDTGGDRDVKKVGREMWSWPRTRAAIT